MHISRLGVAAFASLATLSVASTPAWSANNNVAPNIVNILSNATSHSYITESLAVGNDGSYWLCATEDGAPLNVIAFRYEALTSSGAPEQAFLLSDNGGSCTDLALDSDGNLYAGLGDEIAVYSPNSTGLATPIRTFTTAGMDTETMAMDTVDRLYVVDGNSGDVLVFDAGASGTTTPSRIIDGSNLGDDDWFVAADASGTVYIADYDEDAIRVFSPTNNGPAWDREISLDGSGTSSFGGITLNGDRLFVTYQDGSEPGIYVFLASSDGPTEPVESWMGPNVVTASDDALYDVGIGACSGELVTFEGYNDRIMTWTNLTTVCPESEEEEEPEGEERELAATGVDLFTPTGIAVGGLAIFSAGVVTLIALRRLSRN